MLSHLPRGGVGREEKFPRFRLPAFNCTYNVPRGTFCAGHNVRILMYIHDAIGWPLLRWAALQVIDNAGGRVWLNRHKRVVVTL